MKYLLQIIIKLERAGTLIATLIISLMGVALMLAAGVPFIALIMDLLVILNHKSGDLIMLGSLTGFFKFTIGAVICWFLGFGFYNYQQQHPETKA